MSSLADATSKAFFSKTPLEPQAFVELLEHLTTLAPEPYATTWIEAYALAFPEPLAPDRQDLIRRTAEQNRRTLSTMLSVMRRLPAPVQRGMMDRIRNSI